MVLGILVRQLRRVRRLKRVGGLTDDTVSLGELSVDARNGEARGSEKIKSSSV
jgi:hypothetical protein